MIQALTHPTAQAAAQTAGPSALEVLGVTLPAAAVTIFVLTWCVLLLAVPFQLNAIRAHLKAIRLSGGAS